MTTSSNSTPPDLAAAAAAAAGAGGRSTAPRFADPDQLVQSWYVACRARDLKAGTPCSFDLAGRRIAVFRDSAGTAHAVDGRCAHLGADLGQGRVVGDQLECAFHCWRWGADGRCVSAPGFDAVPDRRLATYPVQERFGLVWIWAGPEALHALPHIANADRFRIWHSPQQHITCHPHLVLGNVFDFAHFDALHGLQVAELPVARRTAAHELSADARGRFASRWTRLRTGSGRGLEATFRILGASTTWAEVRAPIHFHVLFTGRPAPEGGCDTRTTFLLPRAPHRRVQAVLLVLALLHDDRKLLDRLQFIRGFTEADSGLAALAEMIDELPVLR